MSPDFVSRVRPKDRLAHAQHWNNETDCEASEFHGGRESRPGRGLAYGGAYMVFASPWAEKSRRSFEKAFVELDAEREQIVLSIQFAHKYNSAHVRTDCSERLLA